MKCATFYFSANYPHTVHRVKVELWLPFQLRKAVTMTCNAAGSIAATGEVPMYRQLRRSFIAEDKNIIVLYNGIVVDSKFADEARKGKIVNSTASS